MTSFNSAPAQFTETAQRVRRSAPWNCLNHNVQERLADRRPYNILNNAAILLSSVNGSRYPLDLKGLKMTLLTFKASEVQKLIDHAKAATETIMSALPCVFLVGNPLDLYENEERIEVFENEWGIYLMSNGRPGPKNDDSDIDFFARPKEAATPETVELERERLFDMMVCHVPLNLNEMEQALASQPTDPDFRLIVSP